MKLLYFNIQLKYSKMILSR